MHDGYRAWQGHDWDVLGRLHAKGMIYDPVGKTKSVGFIEEGLRESGRLFIKLFAKAPARPLLGVGAQEARQQPADHVGVVAALLHDGCGQPQPGYTLCRAREPVRRDAQEAQRLVH